MNYVWSAVMVALWISIGFIVLSLVVFIAGVIISSVVWVFSELGKWIKKQFRRD